MTHSKTLSKTHPHTPTHTSTSHLSTLSVLTEHQLFDVFNNAIVSLYRSEDEGGGHLGSGGETDSSRGGMDVSRPGSSGASLGPSGGGNSSGDSGGGGGTTPNGEGTGHSPVGGGGGGGGGVTGAGSGCMMTNDALLFHEKCGTLIKLSNNNKTAERRRPLDEFNNGVVMTNRPLRHNEMFEVSAAAKNQTQIVNSQGLCLKVWDSDLNTEYGSYMKKYMKNF